MLRGNSGRVFKEGGVKRGLCGTFVKGGASRWIPREKRQGELVHEICGLYQP